MVDPDPEVVALTDGSVAHRIGWTIGDCPHGPGDPAGDEWRRAWIATEVDRRTWSGELGATDEQYRAGGLKPPQRDQFGRPVGVADQQRQNMDRMIADMARVLSKTLDEAAAAIRRAFDVNGEVMSVLRRAIESMEEAKAAPPSKRHRPCPRHGPTDATAGMCRPCARGAR